MKRFTSFLLGTLAALLLSIPTQAADTQKALGIKARPTLRLHKDLAKQQNAGRDVKMQMQRQIEKQQSASMPSLQKALAEKKAQDALFAKGKTPWTFKGTPVRMMTDREGRPMGRYAAQQQAKARSPYKVIEDTEEVDDNGIIIKPAEGEHKFYDRTGMGYYVSNQQMMVAEQSGKIEIVECPDGRVYFKDFISSLGFGSWIKGQKVGNTITIPVGQVIMYNSTYSYGLYVAPAIWNEGAGYIQAEGDITMTVDGNTITLDNSDEDHIAACFWTDDNSFSGYGDYNTVFSFDPEAIVPELVVLPAGAQVEEWYTKGSTYASQTLNPFKGNAKVAFVGNEVYLGGIFEDFPESWIKGTLDGTTVTFAKNQFIGYYSTFEIYATGDNPEAENNDETAMADFVMTYDATAGTLTSVNSLIANTSLEKIYFLEYINDVVISREDLSKVNELPYVNELSTAEAFAEFTVIDANEDGKTWSLDDSEEAAQYTYSSNNKGDDWLISPAIKLEAGKNYRVAIDAKPKLSSYPERFEMMMGTQAAADALTTTVIAPTDLTEDGYITFENEAITVSEDGYYYFGVHAISDADSYKFCVKNFVVEVGADPTAPAAVTELSIVPAEDKLEAAISFKAPATSINGEALAENLTKIEILRNGEVIKTFENVAPAAECSFTDNDETLAIGYYTYQVIPYNASGAGKKSDEIKVFLTTILDVPYTADFSVASTFDAFIVLDANEDGSTWKWSAGNKAYYLYGEEDADDYLITTRLHLLAGKNYEVLVNANNGSNQYPERFEVLVGKEATAEGLTTPAIDATDVLMEVPTDYEGTFSVAEEGNYYVAIHAISDADQWRLSVNKLVIDFAPEPTAPAAVANLTVKGGAEGAEEAIVEFNAPNTSVNGNDLTENLTKIDILRNDTVVKSLEDVPAGSQQTWTDTDVKQGKTYTYQVIPYNASGRGIKSDKVSVYVGIDTPNDVKDFSLTDNGTSIKFDWSRVETGVNGGFIDPTKIDYLVWSLKIEQSFFGAYLDYDQKLDSLRDVTTTTVDYNTDEGEQEFKYFGIEAKNEIGKSGLNYQSVLAGAPYDLPVVEGFAGSQLHYYWYGDNVSMYVSSEASDEDGVALKLVSDEEGIGVFYSGKLNLKSVANPALVFDVRSASNNAVYIYGAKEGEEWNAIAGANVTADYSTVKVPLSTIKDGRYGQIAIVGEFKNPTIEDYDFFTDTSTITWGDSLVIDNIRIMDLYEYDLAVSINAPKSIVAGKTADISIKLKNEGENVPTNYAVKLFADDVEVFSQTPAQAPAPLGGSVELNYQLSTSIFDKAADKTLRAEVVWDSDLNPDNNISETILSIVEPTAPAPTDVTATQPEAGDDVTVTWKAPEAAAYEEATENFDDATVFETFSIGGITAEQHSGTIGNWKVYDADGQGVYGWESTSVSYDHASEPAAWQVFDPVKAGFGADNGLTHSGSQSLMSQCAAPADDNSPAVNSDDWLISPEMPGVAQTLKFFACQVSSTDPTASSYYGLETFEVWASSTDSEMASFTKVGDGQITTDDWAEFSFDLPAGTKFFAIRHTSKDVFALFVDDITFLQAGAEVASYNIYVDQVVNMAVQAPETTANVNGENLEDGIHQFSVTAVYTNGVESKPVTVTLSFLTTINQLIATGKPVNVYTIDGKLIGRQVTNLKSLKSGAYLIDNKKVIVK